MAKSTDAREAESLTLECKECHEPVNPADLVAYHLVDRVLYGWCQDCFGSRPARGLQSGALAAVAGNA